MQLAVGNVNLARNRPMIPFSDMIAGGKLDVEDVFQPKYDEINKKYGTNEKP